MNDSTQDDEIIREFLVESHENLSRLDQELVELEKRPKDTALLASIFRIAGSSRKFAPVQFRPSDKYVRTDDEAGEGIAFPSPVASCSRSHLVRRGSQIMRISILTAALLLVPAIMVGEDALAVATPGLVRTYTVGMQGGFTNTFQMVLGGTFGKGADWQDRYSLGVNNLWRDGDSLTAFGWSTTDLPTATPNWQAGLIYKNRVLKTKHHTLALSGGIQRWVLPSVKTGAKDWLVSGNLLYNTSVKGLPITVSQDSWSLLSSTLPIGSAMYTQIYTQHTLLKREGFQLALRHGPAHTYAWGFYGAQGNRVVRYNGSLVATWQGTTFEGGCRQQFGLQDGIHNNRYWSFLVTRQFTGPFGSSGK